MKTIALVAAVALLTLLVGVANGDSFRAAVVEYAPVTAPNPVSDVVAHNILKTNLDAYDSFANQAAVQNASIIVFPENGLYGPDFPSRSSIKPYLQNLPAKGTVSCNQDQSYVASRLSCMALKHGMFVVADLASVVPCAGSPNCPPDGQFQYNTAVAFDPSGALVAVYHKTHLFYEPEFDAGTGAAETFEAFGTKIGLFVCFDIMFQSPAMDMVKDGVTVFAYPTNWMNFAPLITATTTQAGWAAANNVALLAANIGSGWMGGGSGIYSESTVLAVLFNLTAPDSGLLVSDVPLNGAQASNQQPSVVVQSAVPVGSVAAPVRFGQYVHDQLPNATVVPFMSGGSSSVQADHNGLHCEFHYLSLTEQGPETYALVAFNGVYNNLFDAKICAVIACANNDSTQCGAVTYDATTLFRDITLCADSIDDAFLAIPLVSYAEGVVADPDDYIFAKGCIDAAHLTGGRLLDLTVFARVGK